VLIIEERNKSSILFTGGVLILELEKAGLNIGSPLSGMSSAFGDADDQNCCKVINHFLSAEFDHPFMDTLIVVTSPEYASRIPGIYLVQYLESEGHNPDIDMFLNSGEAAIIDIVQQTRCSLPDATVLAMRSMLGMRQR
jgi:hypothetical protein